MPHPLKTLREATELSRTGFALSIGIGNDFCYQVEEGYENLGAKSALRVADRYRLLMARLGITVEDLLRGKRINV